MAAAELINPPGTGESVEGDVMIFMMIHTATHVHSGDWSREGGVKAWGIKTILAPL